MLRQMGGCFALIGKKSSKLPLYKKQKLYLEEMELMESMLMNHTNIKLYNSQDKDLIRKANSYSCSVERCNDLVEFLSLIKHDFQRESILKRNMFGKTSENHDCPELAKFFLNAITLGQTFNDDFTLIRGDGIYVPLGTWQRNLERWCQVVPPCEMVKLRLIIISFVHKEIMNQWEFKKDCGTNVHQFISNHVFFHDRLLERWLKLCSYEIVSRDISFELSSNNAMHAEAVIKTLDNVFIIFDNEVDEWK